MTAVAPPLLSSGTLVLSNGKLGEAKRGEVWACAANGAEPAIMSASNKVLFIEPSDC